MEDQGISEAASENKPKHGRGRPSSWAGGTDHVRKTATDLLWRTSTDRGRANNAYALNAIKLLEENGSIPRYGWILGDTPSGHVVREMAMLYHLMATESKNRRDRQPPKLSILSELGRIQLAFADGDEWALKLADQLCQEEPKSSVKEAAARLRQWRLEIFGKDAHRQQGSSDDLSEALDALIDRYAESHSGVTDDMILKALATTTSFREWVAEEPETESA